MCLTGITIGSLGMPDFTMMINTQQGKDFIDTGLYNEAIGIFNKVIKRDPNMYLAYRERAIAHYNIGQYDMALADCDTALELYWKDYNALVLRATIYYELGQIDRATEDINQVISINPNFATAYVIRAIIYYDLRYYYLVIEDCNKAIILNNNQALPYYIRGLVSFKAGLLDTSILEEAIVDFDKAIDLEPDTFRFYYHRGLAYKSLGDVDKANLDFWQVLNFSDDPDLVLLAEQQLEQLLQ
jgi:tetratricopeptide (TPR) repeat protein